MKPLVVECEFDASIELVWQCLTEPKLMKEWYFDIIEFKAEKGFKFQFEGNKDGRVYIHLCEILEVVPLRLLKHSWAYSGYEGISYVTFELFDFGEKTLLRLTHDGLERLKGSIDFDVNNFIQGWEHIIKKALKGFLEKH